MNCRRASSTDATSLAVIGSSVWIATYAPDGVPAEFARYVLKEFTEAQVLARMAAGARYWVAEQEGRLVGFAEIAPDQRTPCLGDQAQAEVVRLYVLEGFTRKGVGGALLDCCVREAADLGLAWIWLSVYHRNERAVAFYEKMGWKNMGETPFVLGGRAYPNFIYATAVPAKKE